MGFPVSTQIFSLVSHRLAPFCNNQLFLPSTEHEYIIGTNVRFDHGNILEIYWYQLCIDAVCSVETAENGANLCDSKENL